MNKPKLILVPGSGKQLDFLENRINLNELRILVMGSGLMNVANYFYGINNDVELIVEDYDSLMSSKFEQKSGMQFNIKIMDFERTDYLDDTFDLVYIQGAVTNKRRNKIIKDVKRILKPEGFLCVGEIFKLTENIPKFVWDIFESSELNPFTKEDLFSFYKERKFEFIDSVNLSYTLKEYYKENLNLLNENISKLNSNEKSYFKSILSKISHESNAYLKLGGDKHIGFMTILLKVIK